MLRIFLLSVLITTMASAQNCGSFVSDDKSQPVTITVYSPESECFTLMVNGAKVNAEEASRVQFTGAYGFVPVVVKLANGNKITKQLAINDTYVTVNFKIVQNKKGKYKLRLEPFTGTTNGPTSAEMLAEMQAKQKAEKEKRDREWDEARAKEKAERDARREEEKAKEREEELAREEERKARWAAESEQSKKDNPGRQGATYEREEREPQQGRQGREVPNNTAGNNNASSGKAHASVPPQEEATIVKDEKKYFADYRKGHQIEFTLQYNGKPACNWDIEILLGDVVVARGHTDSEGKFSSTYYGLLNTSFKVEGKRKNVDWSVDGIWYMADREYKAGKLDPMDIAKFEEYIQKEMGMNMSYAGYGLTTGCQ